MRLKTILAGFGLLLSSAAMAQTDVGKAADGSKILKGKVDMKVLTNDSTCSWFYYGINKYEPDVTHINVIKANNTKYKFVALASTWDAASKKLLPEFYKVMILSSVPEENFEAYTADQKQQTGTDADRNYKFKTTPTFLVLKEGKEVGRITTQPNGSLEADIANIIFKANDK